MFVRLRTRFISLLVGGLVLLLVYTGLDARGRLFSSNADTTKTIRHGLKDNSETNCRSGINQERTDSSDLRFTISMDDMTNLLSTTRPLSSEFSNFSCRSLFENDKIEIEKAKHREERKVTTSADYIHMLTNCEDYITKRGFLDSTFTVLETEFPIAFSIIMHKDVEQAERLLRAIYRPQNFYCIHLDSKAREDEKTIVEGIASCFSNVFVPSHTINVIWGNFSVLEAELICMRELMRYTTWKYFINLCGQDFPLKTNLELVKILKTLKGASIAEGSKERVNLFTQRFENAGPPPHGLVLVKGLFHVALNREFVEFVLLDYRSLDFLEWLRKTGCPDETFFPTLNHNPHLKIPGSFLGDAEEYPQKPSIIRYKNKMTVMKSAVWSRPCDGKYVRGICILGVGDLHRLPDNIAFFVNKLHIDYQPLAFECLEQHLFNKTRQQYLEREYVDVGFYEHLDQVKMRYVRTTENKGNS